MIFSKNIIIGESIENKTEILDLFKDGNTVFLMYVICIYKNTKTLFEIYESSQINKKLNNKKNITAHVIAIAQNKDEAKQIIVNLLKEYIAKNNDFNSLKQNLFKKYF